jgi:glycosyltransferase involved in cell wall biosynthesis
MMSPRSNSSAALEPSQDPIIFLTESLPVPAVGAVKYRDLHLIELLSRYRPVRVLYFVETGSPESHHPHTIPHLPQVTFVPIKRSSSGVVGQVRSLFRSAALQGFCLRMVAALHREHAPGRVLWVSRLTMAGYVPRAREMGYKIILDEHHIESHRILDDYFDDRTKILTLLSALQARFFEKAYCREVDTIVTASELAAARMRSITPQCEVRVIPNGIDDLKFKDIPAEGGKGLLFWGMLERPANEAGLLWFCDEILPRIRMRMKERTPRIRVAGTPPRPALRTRLEREGIEIIPPGTETSALLAQASICFFPCVQGDAAHLRILESMAAGKAVVTTGRGAAGLSLTPTYDIFIADQADPYAGAICKLLSDPHLLAQTSEHARKTIDSRYDWQASVQRIEVLLREVGLLAPATRAPASPKSLGSEE